MHRVPLIRAGVPTESALTAEVCGVDGTPLAIVDQAPPLLAKLTVNAPRAGSVPSPAVLAKAGELFATATLNGLTPQEYCELHARVSGIPIRVSQRSLADIASAYANAGERVAAETPAGISSLTPSSISPLWRRRGDVLAVIAPSNNPGTHVQWIIGLACGYRIVVRPGAKDPFTPARLITALLQAGVDPPLLSMLPGGHATADALVEAADLSLVFGGDSAMARYASNRRVIPRGPGWSKLLVAGPASEADLGIITESVGFDAGLRCTNASAVFTDGDPRELGEAIAARLASLHAAEPQSPKAELPVLELAAAKALRSQLDSRLNGAIDVAAKHYPNGTLVEFGDGSAALRPAVLVCDRSDHPGRRTELPFPCVWVLPWRREDGIAPLRDTLALTLLGNATDLAEAALAEPSIRKVLSGPMPTFAASVTSPHDGYLSHDLMEVRAYGMAA